MYGLNRKLDDEVEKISQLEDIEIRTMLTEAQREKKAGGEIRRASVICWMISSHIFYHICNLEHWEQGEQKGIFAEITAKSSQDLVKKYQHPDPNNLMNLMHDKHKIIHRHTA